MTISGNEARQNRNTPGAEPSASALSISPLTLPFRKGEILAHKYRVESLIGTGGIGFVIAATHVDLGERLALKFLRPEFVAHPEAVRRFASEARHAARIRSEHVARVYDVGSLPDGAPFIVMEYLEGTDLHRLLYEVGPLSVERAVGFVVEACAALAAAHACYIVHRDIKPDNLFLARQPHGTEIVKVLDFGISKAELDATLHEDGAPSARQTVGALGSPSYMAPEQIRAAADVDARADIWSLGCVLYELLTQRHAFDAPTLMQVCAAVLETEPVPLSSHRPDVPAELEAVVMRCLEKDPARRYPDLAELVVALSPFAPVRSRASIEKTIETVGNIRPHSADDVPPSSRVVRSRPTNDRPPLDESAVRPLPQEPHDVDAEWEAIASDRDPPSLRAPVILDEAKEVPASSVAVPVEEDAKPVTEIGDEAAAFGPADGNPLAREDDDEEPTHVLAKALLSATPVASPSQVEPVAEAPGVNDAVMPAPAAATRLRPVRGIDSTPSIIIQHFPRLPTVEPVSENWGKRSLAPLWIALALAVLAILVVEWSVWWPSPEQRAKRGAPPQAPATMKVVDTAPAPPPPTVTTPAHEDEAPVVAADEQLAPSKPRRVMRRRLGANTAWRARSQQPVPDVPKIQAIAEEVELASEDETPTDGTGSETPAAARSPEPEQPSSGSIAKVAGSEPIRTSGSASPTMNAAAALSAAVVARVVRDHASEIQACYDRAAMEHPDLRGRITLRAVVDESGSVTSASASAIEDGARLSACIAERARHWRFPEPSGGNSPISYTFVFE